jgi:hypothetical protein
MNPNWTSWNVFSMRLYSSARPAQSPTPEIDPRVSTITTTTVSGSTVSHCPETSIFTIITVPNPFGERKNRSRVPHWASRVTFQASPEKAMIAAPTTASPPNRIRLNRMSSVRNLVAVLTGYRTSSVNCFRSTTENSARSDGERSPSSIAPTRL